MKLSPKAEKVTRKNPDELNADQDFLLLEMAKILEEKDAEFDQKDDIIEKKIRSHCAAQETYRPFTGDR